MTREELRKKRQEIAKNNGYSEYSSKKYSQQPMTTQETSESNIMPRATTSQMPVTPSVSTWDKVQSKLASNSVSQERLKNTRNIPVTNTQPITQVETKKGNPNSKLNNLAYVGKKTVAGLLGGVTGLGQTAVTETASQLKKGEKESTGQAVTNLANKMLLPDSVNMIDATKETIKGNIDILKDKNKNVIQKIAGIGQNSVSGAVNTLPFKQKTNAVIQTIGSILKDKQTSNTALEVNKAISQPSQNFNQQLAEESERYGKPTQYAGEALQSVGNMIPSIATSMITGDPSAGLLTMGLSAKGSSTNEALNKGVELEDAVKRGDTDAMIEVGTEMLTGGVNIFGKGALDDLVQNGIVKNVKNEVARFFVQQGVNIGGEVLEETISDVLGTILDKGTTDPNANYSLKDWGKTALTTTLSTVVLNALTGGLVGDVRLAQNRNELRNQVSESNLTDSQKENINNKIQNEKITNQEELQNEIQKLDTIENSGLDEERKVSLLRVADKNNLDLDQISSLIEADQERYGIEQNQDTRIENNEVLNQEQQTIQDENKTAQNETSQQPSEYTTNLMKSIDNYNNSRQEGQEIFDINNEETRKEIESIQKVAENRNINITFDESRFNNNNINAFYEYDDNGNVAGIVLNPNTATKKYVQNLVVHEMTHSFEGSKEYEKLSKAVLDYAKSKGEYNKAFQDLKNTYAGVYSGEKLNQVVEKEAVANILGEKLGSKEFIDDLVNGTYSQENRNFVQKIYDFVKEQINRFKGYKDQEAYWNNVKKLFDEAYQKSEISKGDTEYSFGGANSQLADFSMLRKARELELDGKSVEEIFKETGWFRGNEGKWRYEIDNSTSEIAEEIPNNEYSSRKAREEISRIEATINKINSNFTNNMLKDAEALQEDEKKLKELRKQLKKENTILNTSKLKFDLESYMKNSTSYARFYPLTEILKNDELYKAYPQLKKIEVQLPMLYRDYPKGLQAYVQQTKDLNTGKVEAPNVIYLTKEGISNKEELKKTLLHEIQHIIQSYEGFSSGSNQQDWYNHLVKGEQEKIGKITDNIIKSVLDKKGTQYVSLARDQLTKLTDSLFDLNRFKNVNEETQSKILSEKGYSNSKTYVNTLNEYIDNAISNLKYLGNEKEVDKFVKSVKKVTEASKKSFELYRNTAGEVEAREVEKRVNMPTRERAKQLPFIKDKNTVYSETMSKKTGISASVKETNTTDSQGRTLSKQQQEYFKDSKVRDENGNLLEVYHGTNNEFTEFDSKKFGKYTGKLKGIWLTDKIINANAYGNNIIQSYANIQNPGSATEVTMNKEQYTELLKNVDVKDTNINSSWEHFKSENDFDILTHIQRLYENKGKTLQEFYNDVINITGIDGIYDEKYLADGSPIWIAFNSNQIKKISNENPTTNPDIRYSQDTTGAWNNFIEKYFKNEGEGTAIKDLKKLPTREYTIQDYEEVINNSANIPEADKKSILKDLEGIELNKQSLNDFKQYVEDLDNNYKEVAQEQEQQRFENKNYKDEGRANLISEKRKEFNTNMDYDDSVVAELDEIIPRNRNGKRTVAQWKNMAKQLGQRIANLSPEQIEDIAVKSYYDLEPTKAITRYDNQSKTNVGYEQLYANDWVNEVYEGVRENRQYSVETENNEEIKLPPKKEEIKLPRPEPKENPQLKITPENEVITEEIKPKTRKEVRKMLLDKMDITADELAEGKDISSINYQMTDPVRVNEKVFGRELGKRINDATINQTKHNTAEKIRWQNKERNEIADLGIKARSKESAAVQKYGEKQWVDKEGNTLKYGDEELARDFKDVKTQEKIKHAAEVIRQKYDTYLDQINEVLTSLGYDEIPKRQDYMRHFQELGDIFSQTGVPFNLNDMSADVLPTDINGLTEFNKPGKNWFASAQKRYGNKTTYDAITGIDGYLEGAGNLIFHTQDIQNYRALSTLIRDTFGATKGFDNLDKLTEEQAQKRIDDIMNNKLSGYAAWLDEQANSLAGKKGAIDRGIERFFGRRIYSGLNTLKSQVGSNMTGFNIRSALTNFISVTQAASKTQKTAMVQGALDTIKNIFHKDNFINESDFLTSRFGSDMLSKKLWQKASNAGQIFMSGTDYFTANLIARSKYYEGLHKGMSKQEALDYSNDFASRVMGDRSQGSTAEAFNSKTLGFLTQFQLETNNQWQYMIHDTKMDFGKEKSISNGMKAGATALFQMGQLAAYSYFFNELFEKVTGSRAAFDPVDIIKKLFGLDDEDEEKGFEERMQSAASELADALPLTSLFGSGGRLPISEALKPLGTAYDYITGGTNKYGNTTTFKDVKNDTLGSLGYIALPTGYGQLRKTVQGLGMYNNELPGSYTDSGNLRYTVDDNMKQKSQAALFGKWANEYAKDYIESGYKTIAQKQIQELKDLGMNSTEYRAYRKGLAQYNKQADKINYINSLNLSDEQKTIMANNVLDSDKYKVDMSNYNDFDSFDEFKKYYQDLYKNKK